MRKPKYLTFQCHVCTIKYNDYNALYCFVRDGAKGTMHIRGYVGGIETKKLLFDDPIMPYI